MMQSENDIENHYWQSHSLHEGQPSKSYPDINSLSISIVLDFQARYDFSAIRLLILCKHTQDFNTIAVLECIDPNQCVSFAHKAAHRRWYRSRLTTKTQKQKHDKVQLPPTRTCTVAFEIVRHDFNNFDLVPIQPQQQQQQQQQQHEAETSEGPRRIVYDRLQPVDPTKPSLLLFLSLNRWLRRVPSASRYGFSDLCIPAHSVRVLPLSTKQRNPSSPLLPSNIIHRIVHFAIGNKHFGWRSALLKYSLVCKAWEHVLEIFFELFDGNGTSPVNARQVLRTLEWRPHYGALIRCHNYRDYSRQGHIFDDGPSGWEAFLGILRYATHVKYLRLPTIPYQLIDEVVSTLRGLDEVHECVVSQSYEEEDAHFMNTADFQTAIANWKNLKNLRLTKMGAARDRDSEIAIPDHLDCSIEGLSLRKGESLTTGQLLRFISPTNCRLTHIAFELVQGPTNSEFRSFLSIAASTLQSIDLFLCRFTCTPDDEEYALDAVMPEMKSLRHLHANRSDIGISSITRKPPALITPEPPPDPNPFYDRISILSAGPKIRIEDVERAMYVTAWRSVTVTWRDLPAWDPALVAKAEQAARSRGVDLTLRQSWSSPLPSPE